MELRGEWGLGKRTLAMQARACTSAAPAPLACGSGGCCGCGSSAGGGASSSVARGAITRCTACGVWRVRFGGFQLDAWRAWPGKGPPGSNPWLFPVDAPSRALGLVRLRAPRANASRTRSQPPAGPRRPRFRERGRQSRRPHPTTGRPLQSRARLGQVFRPHRHAPVQRRGRPGRAHREELRPVALAPAAARLLDQVADLSGLGCWMGWGGMGRGGMGWNRAGQERIGQDRTG